MITMREIDDAVQNSKEGRQIQTPRNLVNVFGDADNDKSIANSRCIHSTTNHRLPENRGGWRLNADLMKL